MKKFPAELQEWKDKIEEKATQFGLDFFPVIFEVLNYDEMNQVTALAGYPSRYPHWTHGQNFLAEKRAYRHGLFKISEMVINNNPCYAYLLESNPLIDQKMVMAHVYAHSDFFKNNLWFDNTNRKMLDEMGNHRKIVQKYIDKQGRLKVEKWFDTCLVLENLIDIHSLGIKRHEDAKEVLEEKSEEADEIIRRLRVDKSYLDKFINPEAYIAKEKQRIEELREKKRSLEKKLKIPSEPEKDVLLFLIENAPLENWQKEIMSIMKEEAYFFVPHAQTKILNEGWASYWTSKVMVHICRDSELVDYADRWSGTMGKRPGQVNPYKIGVELFRDIEDRWNKGKFGKEWEECLKEGSYAQQKSWDKKLNKGLEKIFEVRKSCNDITFLDRFLTKEFCEEQDLFSYEEEDGRWVIDSRDFKKIKNKLLLHLTNRNNPAVYVKSGNYKKNGSLLLIHQHEGLDLDQKESLLALKYLYDVWGKPVFLQTIYDNEEQLWSYDSRGSGLHPI